MAPHNVDGKPHVVFIFAHQDDEFSAAPWIDEEITAGHRVSCAYLTDGSARADASVRDAESLSALALLGVRREDVAFLSDRERIHDGALVSNLDRASALLGGWLNVHAPSAARIYSLAWEGGHPDHDAAHLVALAAAVARGLVEDSWQLSIYNAYRCPKPLYRVLKQLPSSRRRRIRSYSVRDAWRFANFCWHYPSQRRTWIGLFPEAAMRRLVIRRDVVVQFDVARVLERPHPGELLYERMFGTSYEEFEEKATWLRTEIVRAAAVQRRHG